MNESEQFEFSLRYEKLINETATEQEISAMEQEIINDPEALKLYQDLSLQHGHLSTSRARDAVETPQARKASKLRAVITTITAYTAVAAAIILGMILFSQAEKTGLAGTATDETTPANYATITATSLAQWGQCSLPTQVNKELTSGSLELLHGTATLSFRSGAVVTLEAPAQIEIVSEMKAIVRHGRVVADVPESAIGFRLDTPDMEVKDLGTVFAVSVDRGQGKSQVDVIEGEIEIFHQASQDRKLLFEKQRATTKGNSGIVNYSSFSEITLLQDTADEKEPRQLVISTADGNGGHASIINTHADTHLYPNLLQAKHSIDGRYSRKFYLKFDLTRLTKKDFHKVDLKLSQVRSPYGITSFVPDCEFLVYALNDEALELWDHADINWKNAPANKIESGSLMHEQHAKIIGKFSIPRGQQEGVCYLESAALAKLIKSDTNGTLTLIVTRRTKEYRVEGLVHTFAGNTTQTAAPPQLIFTLEE
ncbi:MAG: hypothetical protein ACI9E1_001176 [Cryomorphaceae bacterium]|jgi:hypothetical protein